MTNKRRAPLEDISNAIIGQVLETKDARIGRGNGEDFSVDRPQVTAAALDGLFLDGRQLRIGGGQARSIGGWVRLRVARWSLRKALNTGHVLAAERGQAALIARAHDSQTVELSGRSLDCTTLSLLRVVGQVAVTVTPALLTQLRCRQLKLRSAIRAWQDTVLLPTHDSEALLADLRIIVSSGVYPASGPMLIHSCPPLPTPVAPLHAALALPTITQELELNKPQVSFLIGENGSRIEYIKVASSAIVKVLPIKNKLQNSELKNPSCVRQSLAITGDLCAVARALTSIQAFLDLYHANAKHKF
ncbi:ABL173Cp [Eremothecium gossypii ATCC 10895]|uniref:ABL173Cp n=1 Tax=Eremothecium gossypii (strain ATCC 10895 / CBS 109.51 / FGSC 9923 / NRRL Y-1056) TaxID=284811 RepID=Q75E43_EREGS|nr:ABL173Cp [Eremothecium gossypii ATCC 10895]AAS50598.1 ABL173Cp [Eremothecium gossypii ATCC 10895]AEY94886.1 FABL173Cp [Eremothecium gossypii FDAG1]